MSINKRKENMLVFYLLSFTWGIVWTLFGLIVLLLVFILFRKEICISFYRGRIRVHFLEKYYGGISLGLVIMTTGSLESYTISDHEIGHTIQAAWFGIFFIPLVAIPSGIRYQYRTRTKKKLKTAYDDIWFERQATKLGGLYES